MIKLRPHTGAIASSTSFFISFISNKQYCDTNAWNVNVLKVPLYKVHKFFDDRESNIGIDTVYKSEQFNVSMLHILLLS